MFPDLGSRLPQLRHWVSSGEALPVELCRSFAEKLPQSTLVNLYGSSEVSADVTCYDTRQAASSSRIPVGRPIANIQIYLLDSHLRPVPIGVAGELYVGGEGLARGYLNRPELTAEKFIPDPFSDEAGARLYRTGDLARYLPDGNIEYLGRIDHQVKIRGYRIELGEVEAALDQHPAVRGAVVSAREDALGDKRLVAYFVVPDRGQEPTTSELRAFMKAKVPEYMVPSAFVGLEAFPLTPNGKVDRKALPAPDPSGFRAENAYAEPRTPAEEALAGIWEEVLGLERVGIHDDFFELGGHSLLAVRVMTRLNRHFGVEVPLRVLFEEPTIEGLALAVTQMQAEAESDIEQMLAQVEQLQGRSDLHKFRT
jgi:acyl carrier protein